MLTYSVVDLRRRTLRAGDGWGDSVAVRAPVGRTAAVGRGTGVASAGGREPTTPRRGGDPARGRGGLGADRATARGPFLECGRERRWARGAGAAGRDRGRRRRGARSRGRPVRPCGGPR